LLLFFLYHASFNAFRLPLSLCSLSLFLLSNFASALKRKFFKRRVNKMPNNRQNGGALCFSFAFSFFPHDSSELGVENRKYKLSLSLALILIYASLFAFTRMQQFISERVQHAHSSFILAAVASKHTRQPDIVELSMLCEGFLASVSHISIDRHLLLESLSLSPRAIRDKLTHR
jgi:hypothetical protein